MEDQTREARQTPKTTSTMMQHLKPDVATGIHQRMRVERTLGCQRTYAEAAGAAMKAAKEAAQTRALAKKKAELEAGNVCDALNSELLPTGFPVAQPGASGDLPKELSGKIYVRRRKSWGGIWGGADVWHPQHLSGRAHHSGLLTFPGEGRGWSRMATLLLECGLLNH